MIYAQRFHSVLLTLLSIAVLLGWSTSVCAQDLSSKLQHADANKSVNFQGFSASLREIAQDRDALTSAQKDLLRYLELWEIAYQGRSLDAISGLRELLLQSLDPALALRARASIPSR